MIFIDTGAWIACFVKRDQYHERAARTWSRLKESDARVFTSDAVFAETLSLMGRKVSPTAAVEAGRFLLGWSKLSILRATREDEVAALDLLRKFADQEIGFVDCLSFALMRRHRIPTAFAFDRHFKLAGFALTA